jgi:molybdopterin-guanine dinucleotide biosynthesis protein A
MGHPKAGVVLSDGRTMAEHVAEALDAVCGDVVFAGAHACCSTPPGTLCIADLRSNCGPLAGIESLLKSARAPRYLVAACDQPLLTPALLCRLVERGKEAAICAFRTTEGKELDPLPLLIDSTLAEHVTLAIDRGRLSIRDFLRERGVRWIGIEPVEEHLIRSFNPTFTTGGEGQL